MKTKLFIAIMLFTFCSSSACFANPIVVSPFGSLFTAQSGEALLINLIVDFIALLLGYLIIRQAKGLLSLRFLPYLGLVFGGGIIIDVVSNIPSALFFYLFPSAIMELDRLIFFLSAGLFLYLYNGFLSKKFQELEGNQARVIGVVMGILTNPMIGVLFYNSVQGLR
jgi:hypothetical protein